MDIFNILYSNLIYYRINYTTHIGQQKNKEITIVKEE